MSTRTMPALRPQSIAAGVVGLVLFAFYLPVFAHAVDVWRLDEEFSFGFLVPPIALGLVWMRRRAILAAVDTGSQVGLIAVLSGLALYVASARSGVHAIAGASFAITAPGAIAYLYGIRAARAAFFPIAFLTFGLCLYRGLLYSVGFTLQNITARYAAVAASHFGAPVHRDGVDLFVGQFHFVVAEACSGMSSLLALLCLGTLVVGLTPASLPRRFLLIGLILPIVLIANVTRVALVLTLAQVFGQAVAHGFIHGAFSAVLFLAAVGLFFLVGHILGCYRTIGVMASS